MTTLRCSFNVHFPWQHGQACARIDFIGAKGVFVPSQARPHPKMRPRWAPGMPKLSPLQISLQLSTKYCQKVCFLQQGQTKYVYSYSVTNSPQLRGQSSGLSIGCSSGNAMVSINKVALQWAWLAVGWVTAFGRINHLVLYPATKVKSTRPFLPCIGAMSICLKVVSG